MNVLTTQIDTYAASQQRVAARRFSEPVHVDQHVDQEAPHVQRIVRKSQHEALFTYGHMAQPYVSNQPPRIDLYV